MVCSAFNDCRCLGRVYELTLKLMKNKVEFVSLRLKFSVSRLVVPIIIGRTAIKQHGLVKHFPTHFLDAEVDRIERDRDPTMVDLVAAMLKSHITFREEVEARED